MEEAERLGECYIQGIRRNFPTGHILSEGLDAFPTSSSPSPASILSHLLEPIGATRYVDSFTDCPSCTHTASRQTELQKLMWVDGPACDAGLDQN